MIDLLANLKSGKISLDEAYDLFDKAVDDYHKGMLKRSWHQETGLDEYEASARLQGATLEELVKLRYEGWPETCCRCHQAIDYRIYGWMIKHSHGSLCLQHLDCPPSSV